MRAHLFGYKNIVELFFLNILVCQSQNSDNYLAITDLLVVRPVASAAVNHFLLSPLPITKN